MRALKSWLQRPWFGPLVALLLVYTLFAALTPDTFLRTLNLVTMLRQTVVTGTPQEVAHRLRPVVDAFGDRPEFHLIVRLHYPGMDYDTASRAVELFGEKVIPALKGG